MNLILENSRMPKVSHAFYLETSVLAETDLFGIALAFEK
jgi:hypothetical protein